MSLPKNFYDRMNEQVLWTLIEHSKTDSAQPYQQVRYLIRLLSPFRTPHLLKFEKIYWSLIEKSNDADLWAAAYVLNDGCNRTEFLHFRNWLLLQGQQTFRRALQDPETLLDFTDSINFQSVIYPDLENELLALLARRTGSSRPTPDYKKFELIGEPWQTDADIIDKVPHICHEMGWGNEIPKGEWRTDDAPSHDMRTENGV